MFEGKENMRGSAVVEKLLSKDAKGLCKAVRQLTVEAHGAQGGSNGVGAEAGGSIAGLEAVVDELVAEAGVFVNKVITLNH